MTSWPLRPRHCPHCSAVDAWQGDGQLWRTSKPVPRVVRWVVVHQCGICGRAHVGTLPQELSAWIEVCVQLYLACPPDAPAVRRRAS
jgi:hypothetical protein